MAERIHTTDTTCPYCGVGCGVSVNGAGESVTGMAAHPANLGRLCVKGAALHETLDHHNRLLYPEVDGAVVDYVVANVTRPGLPSHTGVPNAQHGFSFSLPDAAAAKLAGAGKHSMAVDAITVQGGTPSSPTKPCNSSPICFEDGKLLEQC